MTERMLNDFYPTPPKVVDLAIDQNEMQSDSLLFEPCAGHSAITEHLYERDFDHIEETDLIWPGLPTGVSTRDATQERFWNDWDWKFKVRYGRGIDWTITNVPFSYADDILPLAYTFSNEGMIMLLRLSYLEPVSSRRAWLQKTADNLKKVIIINPRVKFRADKKGTDSVTCAWFVWQKSFSWSKLGLECPFIFTDNWKK